MMYIGLSLSGVLRYVMNYNYMFKFPIALPATPSKTRASLREERLLSHRLLIIRMHLVKHGQFHTNNEEFKFALKGN